jgi:hypothetical protein
MELIFMKISSPDFKNNEMIPKKFTCQGEEGIPTLILDDIPQNTKSLVLIMDDPDAPSKTFVHWILFNIPLVNRIDENFDLGTKGINSLSELGYTAPCPPTGTHRYFFKLYALDNMLDLKQGASKADVEKNMKNHVLDEAQLIGLYKKS